MKFSLVENWRCAYRWVSLWCAGASASLGLAWLALPAKYQDMVPPHWVVKGVIFFVLTGAAGRMVKQTPSAPECPPESKP